MFKLIIIINCNLKLIIKKKVVNNNVCYAVLSRYTHIDRQIKIFVNLSMS